MKYFTTYFISKSAICKNLQTIKKSVGNNTLICAMVKANAYGHDCKTVCKILKNKVDFFGVANVEEAKEIRRFDKQTKILIVGKTPIKSYNWCAKNNVSVTISSLQDLHNLKLKSPLCIHIKIDTGLSRFGFQDKKILKVALSEIAKNNLIKIEGAFTHFSTKDNNTLFIRQQYEKFISYKDILPKDIVFHCCNSYATINHPEFKLDMVRVGYALYTCTKTACKITSKIIDTRVVECGTTVGYDRTHTTTQKTKLAVVPIGYADGLDRHLGNNFCLFVKGKFTKIVGNICMDVCMLDITNTNAKVGDDVEILGKHISLSDYSKKLNTSTYDIMLKFNHARMNIKTDK